MVLSYEEQRIQNIKDNEALLLSFGLSTPNSKVKAAPAPKPKITPKIKPKPKFARRMTIDSVEIPSPRSARSARSFAGDESSDASGLDSPLRRSGRSSAKKNYAEIEKRMYEAGASSVGSPIRWTKRAREGSDGDYSAEDDEGEERMLQRKQARLGVRTQDPYVLSSPWPSWAASLKDRKTFGHIPGVEVGRWWASRMEASTDAIHAPVVAGISGGEQAGAYSVALSGGYPDDVDLGEAFTYTGAGGRDLKGTANNPKNLRTAPQTFNQSFEHPMNAALKRSAETRKPVRVIRGFKLDSPYAPAEGYRYDGLYLVERAWMAKGLTNGLLVCRYAFKRMGGQPSLPVRSESDNADDE